MKNRHHIVKGIAYIEIPKSRIVIMDAVNLYKISHVHWYALRQPNGDIYAAAWTTTAQKERRLLLMHRVLLNNPKGRDTDHLNGDSLDNRCCNIKISTRTYDGEFARTNY